VALILDFRTIELSDFGYRIVFFSAIELSEYRISYWRIQETIGLSDIGSGPQSIGLSDIGLRKTVGGPSLTLSLETGKPMVSTYLAMDFKIFILSKF
jgi:hypothetical protein